MNKKATIKFTFPEVMDDHARGAFKLLGPWVQQVLETWDTPDEEFEVEVLTEAAASEAKEDLFNYIPSLPLWTTEDRQGTLACMDAWFMHKGELQSAHGWAMGYEG